MTWTCIRIIVVFILADFTLPYFIYWLISKSEKTRELIWHFFFQWKGIMESNEKQSECFEMKFIETVKTKVNEEIKENTKIDNATTEKKNTTIKEITTTQFKKPHWLRVTFAVLYLIMGIAGLIVSLFLFSPDSCVTKECIWRKFLWCFSCTSIGFAAIAFHWSRQPDSPLPDYIIYYPLQLIAIALLVLFLLIYWIWWKPQIPTLIPTEMKEYIFYSLSGSLCFTLGFYVDGIGRFLKIL